MRRVQTPLFGNLPRVFRQPGVFTEASLNAGSVSPRAISLLGHRRREKIKRMRFANWTTRARQAATIGLAASCQYQCRALGSARFFAGATASRAKSGARES